MDQVSDLVLPVAGADARFKIAVAMAALFAANQPINPRLCCPDDQTYPYLGLAKRRWIKNLINIVEFSAAGDFISTSAKNYSSRIRVRLRFSKFTIMIKPDVVFLDEVLAFGDSRFVIRCLNVVRKSAADSAVVFVSYNIRHISSFCPRGMVMERGKAIRGSHNPAEGIDRY